MYILDFTTSNSSCT